MRRAAPVVSALLLLAATAWTVPAGGVDREYTVVPRQVRLFVEDDRLVAANVRLNRFDEFRLEADESVVLSAQAEAVILVATATRLLAYGPVVGWRELALMTGERAREVTAEDFAAFATTDRRFVNFNALSGAWGEYERAR